MAERSIVVFDIGGVLVHGDYARLGRELFDDEADVEHFLAEILGEEFHLERDRGVPMAEVAERWAAAHPEYAEQIHAFSERFPEIWAGPVPGSPELLAELQAKGVPVYALSNWGHESWIVVKERFDFLRTLDGVLISSHVGLIKPDPEIFRRFCATFDVRPDDCVFIDDMPRNVAAAESLGFHGIVFTDAGEVRHKLEALGLL